MISPTPSSLNVWTTSSTRSTYPISVHSLFAFDQAVFTNDYVRVAKHLSRFVEAYTVFRHVSAIVAVVPFEPDCHYVYTA